MRSEVYKITKIGKIQQGMIFNGAVSDSYNKSKVFGIIVTPRCDIDNSKVHSYHYLPIISFEEWYYQDFWNLFSSQIVKQLYNLIKIEFEKNEIDSTILKYANLDDVIEKNLKSISKKNEKSKIIDLLTSFYTLKSIDDSTFINRQEKDFFVNKNPKKAEDILREVKGNNRKEFYLIEHWESNQENQRYLVVLMREIRSIPAELAKKIGNGVLENDLRSIKNSNLTPETDDGIICFHAELKSPFIEHLIQQFSLNFERIGVENHPDGLESKLIISNWNK